MNSSARTVLFDSISTRSMARVGISASITRRTVFAKASVVLRREKSMDSWFIVRMVTCGPDSEVSRLSP